MATRLLSSQQNINLHLIAMKRILFVLIALLAFVANSAYAQTDQTVYLRLNNSSTRFLTWKSNKVQLSNSATAANGQFFMTRAASGYYYITLKSGSSTLYLNSTSDGALSFTTTNSNQNSHFALEASDGGYYKIKNRANGKYVGVDGSSSGTEVKCDKDGKSPNHLWYLASTTSEKPAVPVIESMISADAMRQQCDGWGVSLCWWANMCGKWSDDKIDEIIDWLVGPDNLNYNIFRYNIGGGDGTSCNAGHMRAENGGKGIRAEMEGFKTSANSAYDWSRDAAQRKIMLKIKEKRPDAIFEAFSNSAPHFMTNSGCTAGALFTINDNVSSGQYTNFANYLVDVCKHYKDVHGIEFYTLEPFNEGASNYWSKNGSQEGCHWGNNSQVNFLKVLYPILKASGLKTVISASDETNVSTSIDVFETYQDKSALNMVEQWNVHTYDGTNEQRTKLNAMVHGEGKRLWMSETGGSESGGHLGSLELAQRLFNDVRYLESTAWIDWQYIEEDFYEWCLVDGDFAGQTYQKVHNYHVRRHISKNIKPGYRFLDVPNDNMLAAINPTRDTLVVVAINKTLTQSTLNLRLNGMQTVRTAFPGRQTNSTSTDQSITFRVNNGVMTGTLPALSIASFAIPVYTNKYDAEIVPGRYYVIKPLYNKGAALSSNGGVKIENLSYTDGWGEVVNQENMSPVAASQTWRLEADDVSRATSTYRLVNLNGEVLTADSNYNLRAVAGQCPSGCSQSFTFERVSDTAYKIKLVSDGRVLDLDGGNYGSGTAVGVYKDSNNPADCHRHWQLTPILLSGTTTGIGEIETVVEPKFEVSKNLLRITCDSESDEECVAEVFTLTGVKVAERRFVGSTEISLSSGFYATRVVSPKSAVSQKIVIP